MAKAKVIAELLGGTYAERMARALAGGWDTDVFHGTADDIQAFALSERGKNTQAKSAQGAFWFVDNPEVAGGYARIAAQPSEATAYQYGGAMTDALAPYSPQGAAIAGALTNAGIQLTSPF